MAKKPIKYCVVNAFTEMAFKGNPAAVCLLEDEEEERDAEWLQAVAREFNMPITCFLTRLSNSNDSLDNFVPKFRIRWFTSIAEVPICGHATLAASYFVFKYESMKSSRIEFISLSGSLTAKKMSDLWESNKNVDNFVVELDFPVIPIEKYEGAAPSLSTIYKSLNVSAANVREIHNTTTENDILVVLESAEAVIQVKPNFDEIRKFPGKGIIITGLFPTGSKFDFATRFFTPKMGVDEDYVCGSAHCALAPYWSKTLAKNNFIAYQASSRSGVLIVDYDDKNQRVMLRGRAVAVMEGSLLV